MIERFSHIFNQPSDGFTLSELTDLIEQKTKDRQRMISELRKMFEHLKPTGGLLNLPLYDWKAIYTTNYDELIEESYNKKHKPLTVYSSNFDFTIRGRPTATRLFKLHGTITKDVSDGHNARIILTESDYTFTKDYREKLYDTFRAALAESNLVIIGHSLADQDIKEVVARAISLNAQAMSAGRITLLMYTPDANRAILYESKGLRVVFGGIDEFFAEVTRKAPDYALVARASDDPLDAHPALRPVTLDVAYETEHATANVSRMFSGWPATYADIADGLTFERTVADHVSQFLKSSDDSVCAIIVGASGVGKTTAARQAILRFDRGASLCWEHKLDDTFQADEWIGVASTLAAADKKGVVFIDDAHAHLHEINELIDALSSDKLTSLKLIAVSSRNNWRPRVKSPNLYKRGKEFHMSRLDNDEIGKLLVLVDNNTTIGKLVENTFAGFSRQEKRRRLVERCEADMFVCMRNIFASESFDDIILREYAALPPVNQDVYRVVAALESSGVRPHRQMIIRLLDINMSSIVAVLDGLVDIITEYPVNEKLHIYGWRGRHQVISNIITRYKYSDIDSIIRLFENVIDNIIPTYDIEIRNVRELCNTNTGIPRIPDKTVQNKLLRMMISVAPGERVPRHRLIRNLIELTEFEQAQTEIRIFDKDFGNDGPVARYKINMMVARATKTSGIMLEDRLAILEQAQEVAIGIIKRYSYTPQVFAAYCEVGFEIFRLSGRMDVFEDAMVELKEAENRTGDPEVTRIIRRFERRIAGQRIVETSADSE